MPSLIIELQDTANDAGLECEKFAPTARPEEPTGTTEKIDVVVTGTWDDVVDFLPRIQKLERGVRVLDSVSCRWESVAASRARARGRRAAKAEEAEQPSKLI